MQEIKLQQVRLGALLSAKYDFDLSTFILREGLRMRNPLVSVVAFIAAILLSGCDRVEQVLEDLNLPGAVEEAVNAVGGDGGGPALPRAAVQRFQASALRALCRQIARRLASQSNGDGAY